MTQTNIAVNEADIKSLLRIIRDVFSPIDYSTPFMFMDISIAVVLGYLRGKGYKLDTPGKLNEKSILIETVLEQLMFYSTTTEKFEWFAEWGDKYLLASEEQEVF